MKGTKHLSRIVNVSTTTVCLLCCIPQHGICEVVKIDQLVDQLTSSGSRGFLLTASVGVIQQKSLESSFTDLIDTISASEQPLDTTREFIKTLLNQVNAQRGTSISFEEACSALRQNLSAVPKEYHDIVLLAIDSIERNAIPNNNQILATAAFIQTVPGPTGLIINWLMSKKEENKTKIDPKKAVFVFAIVAAGIAAVSIFRPEAASVAGSAMTEAAKVILGI